MLNLISNVLSLNFMFCKRNFLFQVNSSFIMNVTDKLSDNQQIMCIAGLDFEIIPDSFNNGRLHIVCNANVFHLYKKQAGVFLIEERPRLASVLGTRESSYIGISYRSIYNCSPMVLIFSICFAINTV